MPILDHRIDFLGIISVDHANPNGDPTNGNRPRIDYEGYGFISDVCLKRKIRDRLLESGQNILIQPGMSVLDRIKNSPVSSFLSDPEKMVKTACQEWMDVRSFGQVMALRAASKKEYGISVGIRGPVSISSAYTFAPIVSETYQVVKCVNFEDRENDPNRRSRDTMGFKHFISHAAYKFVGGIYPQLAEKTGFTVEDAELIKQAIINLFENDSSSARPIGSMAIQEFFWWEHPSKTSLYPPIKVHSLVSAKVKDEFPYYEASYTSLEGLTLSHYKMLE